MQMTGDYTWDDICRFLLSHHPEWIAEAGACDSESLFAWWTRQCELYCRFSDDESACAPTEVWGARGLYYIASGELGEDGVYVDSQWARDAAETFVSDSDEWAPVREDFLPFVSLSNADLANLKNRISGPNKVRILGAADLAPSLRDAASREDRLALLSDPEREQELESRLATTEAFLLSVLRGERSRALCPLFDLLLWEGVIYAKAGVSARVAERERFLSVLGSLGYPVVLVTEDRPGSESAAGWIHADPASRTFRAPNGEDLSALEAALPSLTSFARFFARPADERH
jgi:hypothetical protein